MDELIAHEEEDQNDSQDRDANWENEEIAPASICEIASDYRTYSVTIVEVSLSSSNPESCSWSIPYPTDKGHNGIVP